MQDPVQSEGPTGNQRASLLGLPAELRLSIYREVFRIKSWEAHQARTRDLSAPKRRLSDQCPLCQSISRHGVYLYPTCKLDVEHEHGGVYMHGSCYTPSGPRERLNRCALLRVCRFISAEASDCLYANTPFIIVKLGWCGDPPRTTRYIQRTFPLTAIQNLYIRLGLAIPDAKLGDRISAITRGILRDREQAHIQLRSRINHIGPGMQEIVLETMGSASSTIRLKVVVQWLALLSECSLDSWYSFVLRSALPQPTLNNLSSTTMSDDSV